MYSKFIICVFLLSAAYSLTFAEPSSGKSNNNVTCSNFDDCVAVHNNITDCEKQCGCDNKIHKNAENKTYDCIINIKLLLLSLTEKHNTADNDMSTEGHGMATKLEAEADRIFQGVIIAAILFIACGTVCTFTACIYCCRINYTDYQLEKSIKVLAKKMGTKSQVKKPSKKPPTAPMAESCNVVVEDAGVFCV